MPTLLPVFMGGAAFSFVAGSALASCIAVGAALCVGTYGPVFHNIETLQLLISLSGIPLVAIIADRSTLAREEKPLRTEELCRMLIETTNDGVWITDDEHLTTFVNHRMAEMLGYMAGEIQDRPLVDFMFPEDVSEEPPNFLRPHDFREVSRCRFRRKDGSELWVRLSASPLLTKAKELIGVMIIVSDTTLLRNTEDTLRRNDKLITAGRLTATISHEINGPLEAVVNIFHLLRNETMTEQAQQYLTLAEREIQRISAITKRTLGLFRDSSSWEEFSLSDLLDDTILFCQKRLVAHSVRVRKDYRSRGIACASRGGIQQVFANLISNALDAMSNGGTLTVRVVDVTENNASGARVEIEDTGKGIANLDLKRVFDPFFTTKQNAGTGLGLWVAKEIIEKHGGTVAVTSRTHPGEKCGTRFSILLPRATAQAVA
jgi:PAS domain S-box-containing protein